MKALFSCSAVVMCGVLAGCAGMSKAMEYGATTYRVKMPEDTYRVFEHPKGDRIMTTPSLGAASGAALAKGMTLGLVDTMSPEQKQEAAARRYLDITGRSACVIKSGYLVMQPQYEFIFSCPPGTVATPAPPIEGQ